MKKRFINILLLICSVLHCLMACENKTHTHNYQQIGSDENYHWYYCSKDNQIKEGSKEEHFDNNNDGYCDVCGYSMPLAEEENIYIDLYKGKKDLTIKGAIPSEISKVKLHYKNMTTNKDYYLENMAVDANSYIFLLTLNTVSNENSPIYIFDIYAYKNENYSTPAMIIDLTRKNFFEVDEFYDEDKSIYTIVEVENEKLAIQAEDLIDYTTTSIELKLVENKPYLIIKAKGPKNLGDVKIEVNNSGT